MLSDMSQLFISTVDTTMSSLYRGVKDGEIIGIIVENKIMFTFSMHLLNSPIVTLVSVKEPGVTHNSLVSAFFRTGAG